jgi:hypothetical protein
METPANGLHILPELEPGPWPSPPPKLPPPKTPIFLRWLTPRFYIGGCDCKTYAIYREGQSTQAAGVAVAPSGAPPLATLDLPAGSYLVTAKTNVVNLSAGAIEVVACIRPKGTSLKWVDIGWLRLAPRWQAGEVGGFSLHGIYAIAAAGGLDLIVAHTGQPGDILAHYVWMTGLQTNPSVTTVT